MLPTSSLSTLYNSFVFSHFSYGLEVWGGCQPKHLKRLISIQKKCIRSVTKSHWLAHTEPRLKNFHFLKVNDQYKLQCLGLMYDMLKGQCPDIYDLKEKLNENAQNLNLRSTVDRPNNLRLLSHKSTQTKSSFLTQTPVLWNELPDDLKQINTRKLFKTKLKQKILIEYKDKVECNNPSCVDRISHLVIE